jgi:predicted transcriptional regulator of viral defense system
LAKSRSTLKARPLRLPGQSLDEARIALIESKLEKPRSQGVTSRELVQAGIHRQVLSRLVAEEALERVARGLYRLPEQPITEHHGLVIAATAAPQGIVCLLSAMQFHGLGTQLPSEVWIAIDRRARRPSLSYPPLRIVRYTGAALSEGVENHRIEGRTVRIYNVAKTLADCFKYRYKIGLDVALEDLREAWRARRFTVQELDRYAAICRVQRVMQPYLEALTA